jgi:phosphohistidine phosphatase
VDHLRPLSARGERDAPVAGRVLRDRVGTPDLVLVSTATRAQQTWTLARRAFEHPPRHRDVGRIYEASVDDLLLVLRELDEEPATLVMVGHNPGLEEFAFALAGAGSDAAAMAQMSHKYPTSGLAVLELARPWEHIVPDCGRLVSFDVPRG